MVQDATTPATPTASRTVLVSRAVQAAIMETLNVPPEDFFHIIHALEREDFLHTPSFGDLAYAGPG